MQSDESDNEEKSKSDKNHKVTKVENVDELELHDELSNDSWTQPVLRGKFQSANQHSPRAKTYIYFISTFQNFLVTNFWIFCTYFEK